MGCARTHERLHPPIARFHAISWARNTRTASVAPTHQATATAQVLRLGNVVPDFSAQTTQGDMPSFHEWIEGSWAILFSHPADFTVRLPSISQPSKGASRAHILRLV